MNLIKIGEAYLNLDLVTDVWVQQGHVAVFFAVPAMYSVEPFRGVSNALTTREVRFSGAKGAALREWLAQHAQDITPDGDDAEDDAAGRLAQDEALSEYESVDDGPTP